MKKNFTCWLVAVILAFSATSCQQQGSGNTNGNGQTDSIKIGLNFELTGGTATYGNDSVNGIEMAISEANKAGGVNGKTIELVKYNNKSEPAESTSLATKLMEQDKVVACLGPATTGNFMATIPASTSSKVPVISASATADNNVTTNASGNINEYVFRICFTDSVQAIALANFASQNLSAKKAVIFKDNASDYAMGLAKNFRTAFEAQGGSIVDEEAYVEKETDFRAILTKIKSNTFDVIFLPGYYQEAGLIISQARELGIQNPILGADGFDSPILAELAGAQALSNVYYSNHYSSLDTSPEVQSYLTKFAEANKGNSPNAFNALGYDLGNFIVDCLKRAESITSQSVKESIAQTTNFKGVTGTFSMGSDHNAKKESIVIIEMENGIQSNFSRVSIQ